MLPGKKFGPEDLLRIVRTRFWLLAVPFAVVAAITAVVARKLPDVYQSQAVIQVVPQRVPENYVKSTVTMRIQDRLQAIKEQILSRTKLENLIQEFNLYPQERQTEIMENVVARMRGDISIVVNRGGDSLTVTYTGRSATTVMKVTEQLASLIINESEIARQQLAQGTDQFLEGQLEDARRKLIDQEKKLEAYRMKYAGELPTQASSNLQAVANTQMQIQRLAEADNRDSDRRLALEKLLKDAETEAPITDPVPATLPANAGTPDSPALRTTAQTLDAAKKQLALLQQRYSDAWPDVQIQKRYVEDLQRKYDAEMLQRPVSVAANEPVVPPLELARRKRIQGLQDEISEIDRQRTIREKEAAQLRKNSGILQQRLDAVPARESEMTELTRDYGTLSSLYNGLLAKKQESKIAANLQSQQIGEQLKLLDPARLPEEPASPNRPLINVIGMVAGLGIGVLFVLLLEYRDASFQTDSEITELLQLPVLAVVPLMESRRDKRRAMRRRVIVGVGLGSTVAGCLAVVLYTFVR